MNKAFSNVKIPHTSVCVSWKTLCITSKNPTDSECANTTNEVSDLNDEITNSVSLNKTTPGRIQNVESGIDMPIFMEGDQALPPLDNIASTRDMAELKAPGTTSPLTIGPELGGVDEQEEIEVEEVEEPRRPSKEELQLDLQKLNR